MRLEWPWNWGRTPSEPPAELDSAELESPTAADGTRPATLSARVLRLETELETLRLDWQETLDKLGRWSSRQAARERARVSRDLDALAGDGPDSAEDAPGTTNGHQPTIGSPEDRKAAKAALRRQIRR